MSNPTFYTYVSEEFKDENAPNKEKCIRNAIDCVLEELGCIELVDFIAKDLCSETFQVKLAEEVFRFRKQYEIPLESPINFEILTGRYDVKENELHPKFVEHIKDLEQSTGKKYDRHVVLGVQLQGKKKILEHVSIKYIRFIDLLSSFDRNKPVPFSRNIGSDEFKNNEPIGDVIITSDNAEYFCIHTATMLIDYIHDVKKLVGGTIDFILDDNCYVVGQKTMYFDIVDPISSSEARNAIVASVVEKAKEYMRDEPTLKKQKTVE